MIIALWVYQGAYESIRTGILEPWGTEPERNRLEIDPHRNWIGHWVRNEPAEFFAPGGLAFEPVYRSPTGWTLKISKPFAFKRSVYTLVLWAPAALSHSATFQVSLLISEPHLSGLNPLPIAPDIPLGPTSWFNPPLIPFISEHNFSGWTQTRGSTPHWWLSSLNLTFRGWTGTHILVQPPTGTFHL